jgi:FlaA1/EpsC-like NDP-sugar epimerase
MQKAENSFPYLPSMKSMSLGNLLEAMASKYLPEGKNLEIVQVGLSKGENFHEKILEDGEYSNEVDSFTIEEITEMI